MIYQINKPIKLTIRSGNPNNSYPTIQLSLVAGNYYYYRVLIHGYILYTGKTFCFNKGGVPVIELDVTNILKDWQFNGFKSIKPELVNQDWKPVMNTDGETLTSLEAWSNYEEEDRCIGLCQWSLKVSDSISFTNWNTVNFTAQNGYYTPWITSSWGLRQEPDKDNSFQGIKSVLKYETDFISHYPYVVTDNYGVFYLCNINTDYMSSQFANYYKQAVYIANKPNFTPGQTQAQDQYTGIRYYTSGAGGYVPFNAPMSSVINSLDTQAYVPDYETNIINGGSSSTTNSNYIYGGTSESSVSNVVNGGDSSTSMTPVYGYDNRYKIWLWTRNTFENNNTEGDVFIGIIDECPADYYLTWLTKSGCPVSYGFSGNSKRKNSVNNTRTLSAENFERTKIQEYERQWTLKSGIVNKTAYDVFADIITSPYVILWERKTDRLYYVNPTTADWEEKTVKESKQPLNFEITVSESQKYTLVH